MYTDEAVGRLPTELSVFTSLDFYAAAAAALQSSHKEATGAPGSKTFKCENLRKASFKATGAPS